MIGIVLGFLIGVYYFRKQMMNMSMDNNKIQEIAKQMGVNVSQKQINQMNKRMKNLNPNRR